ncbi:hypothetical protein [Corynebacterium sp. LK2510]|uniref:hypothetical protein n=1 Tax=Corynebacterium sp. LK2510 TaxID=3110472 RepID=UPI0034CFD2A9
MTTPDTHPNITPAEPVESGEPAELVGTVVEHPIIPIISDTTPTPAAPTIPEPKLAQPAVQTLDLAVPILDVLTNPNL